MSLTTQQRSDQILAQVYQNGHVTVKELAGEMDVSEATVRRDLRSLADSGQLELVYGGATLVRNRDYSFQSKRMRNVDAKRTVGQLAAQLISDHDQIFIDSGTTCFEMVPFLKQRRGLSVVVNSARLTMELCDAAGCNLISLGGQYRPDRMDTIGPLATATLDQLRGYRAMIGADGLSMEFGLTAGDIESAHLYRLAVKNARETILLVDHTKFLAPSLFKIVDWEAISRVVTDQKPSPDWTSFLEARGIDVIYPDHQPQQKEDNTR